MDNMPIDNIAQISPEQQKRIEDMMQKLVSNSILEKFAVLPPKYTGKLPDELLNAAGIVPGVIRGGY